LGKTNGSRRSKPRLHQRSQPKEGIGEIEFDYTKNRISSDDREPQGNHRMGQRILCKTHRNFLGKIGGKTAWGSHEGNYSLYRIDWLKLNEVKEVEQCLKMERSFTGFVTITHGGKTRTFNLELSAIRSENKLSSFAFFYVRDCQE
jgi:hypothetical protein